MKYKKPLRQILQAARPHWDNEQVRPAVRKNFQKVVSCGTEALGAEVFASDTESKLVYHTCKSRACPSCGHRATELWQREQWNALPDIPYVDICLTMPDVLWSVLKRNRHLLHDLPAIGAAAIQQYVKTRYGAKVMIMVVQHTFGRKLNFNSHLHIMVSSGGLRESDNRWVHPLVYDKKAIERNWRFAVILYLSEAARARVLASDLPPQEITSMLRTQYRRWWSIHVSCFRSKQHFLRYAGRYIRRPPIAQHRFETITDEEVRFWRKDLREKRKVLTQYSLEGFAAALAEHVPDHYRHGIRYFGLLSPRSKNQTAAASFSLLGQTKRPRPHRLSWAESLRRRFGVDPLVDSRGQAMVRVGRRAPISI
jgi:hypothetical protein